MEHQEPGATSRWNQHLPSAPIVVAEADNFADAL